MIVNFRKCDGTSVELNLDGIRTVRQGRNRLACLLKVPVTSVNLISKEGLRLLDEQSSEVLASPHVGILIAYNKRNELEEDIEVVIEREELLVAEGLLYNARIHERQQVLADNSDCPTSLRLGRKSCFH